MHSIEHVVQCCPTVLAQSLLANLAVLGKGSTDYNTFDFLHVPNLLRDDHCED